MPSQRGFEEALIGRRQVRDADIRNNDRVLSDDAALANEMWRLAQGSIAATFKGRRAIGLNERIRFYRYDIGQKFDWHLDGFYRRPNGEESQLTLMVYLNDDFEGGGTSFTCGDRDRMRFEPFRVQPSKGAALFFHHRILHRGDPVTAGRKYVLRSDIMYAPLQAGIAALRPRTP